MRGKIKYGIIWGRSLGLARQPRREDRKRDLSRDYFAEALQQVPTRRKGKNEAKNQPLQVALPGKMRRGRLQERQDTHDK